MNIQIPDIDDENLEEQMIEISESDRELLTRINLLTPFLSWSEKMAVGLHAYYLIDTSHAQLCDLKPKHEKFGIGLQAVINLIQLLSPQAKAEIASEILLEDWDLEQ
jgi:hypothetical protein